MNFLLSTKNDKYLCYHVFMKTRSSVKRCSTCMVQSPGVHFARNKCTRDGLQNECDPCRKHRQRNWWHKKKIADPEFLKKSAEVLRRNVLLRTIKKYSLTQAEYDALVAKGCGICGGPPDGRGRYAFDHNHETNKFRGLLCSSCNTALGLFKDSSAILGRAKLYLAEHQE